MPGTLFPPGKQNPPRGYKKGTAGMLTHISVETLVRDFQPLSKVSTVSNIHAIPGMSEIWGMHRMAGQFLVGMMNVPAIATGDVKDPFIREWCANLNARLGYVLDGFVWCPHDPASPDVRLSVCNCRIPKYYNLPMQAHFMLESTFGIPFMHCYQTIVGGDGYKEMAESGNYNYVSEQEIRDEALKGLVTGVQHPLILARNFGNV